MRGIELITSGLFEDLEAEARASARLRKNHNFHAGPTDNPHRFLNALVRGTYVRPHRHVAPPKDEAFLVLRGRALVIVFDDDGRPVEHHLLASDGPVHGIDLKAGLWHTVIAASDCAICYEVKPGPWEPASDKDFAPWAPAEGDPNCTAYLESLTAVAGFPTSPQSESPAATPAGFPE